MKPVHLIIGGTTKSGTTSLFHYLGDHPEVCASSMKETRFFLDKEYPLASKYRYEDGLENYLEFFKHHRHEKILMEATPDYLYSKNTPVKIKESLSNVKLIFILREPKARFISWFNFSKQIGKIDSAESLERYIQMQLLEEEYQEQHLMALQQGNYSAYLKAYCNHFPKEDLYICYFEDLANNPDEFMKKLTAFLSIDAGFYEAYSFERHNTTIKTKNQSLHAKYIQLSFNLRKLTHNKKVLHGVLKKVKKILNPMYEKLNSQRVESQDISERANLQLDKFYRAEKKFYEQKYEGLHTVHELKE